jgi:hypothetical protein
MGSGEAVAMTTLVLVNVAPVMVDAPTIWWRVTFTENLSPGSMVAKIEWALAGWALSGMIGPPKKQDFP